MKRTERYKTNPFVEDMLIPVGTKRVRISTFGREDNILINQSTGEVSGTHVVAVKRVDTEKFVKTFADYMAFTFDLTKAGNKALRVVMWAVQEQALGKDIVVLDRFTLEGFLSAHGFSEDESAKIPALSLPTFARGLSELETAHIIAKTLRPAHYFINPSCMFNGDRVAFTTVIERGKKSDASVRDKLEAAGQARLVE